MVTIPNHTEPNEREPNRFFDAGTNPFRPERDRIVRYRIMVFVSNMQDASGKSMLVEMLKVLRPKMLAVLRQNGVRSGEAEDLIQETALAAVLQWEQIRSLDSWLLVVLRNRARDRARRRLRDPAVAVGLSEDLDTLGGAAEAPQLTEEKWLDLKSTAEAVLSERGWSVLAARLLEGLSNEETAARFRYNETNVRKICSRARLRLQAAYAARTQAAGGTYQKRRK